MYSAHGSISSMYSVWAPEKLRVSQEVFSRSWKLVPSISDIESQHRLTFMIASNNPTSTIRSLNSGIVRIIHMIQTTQLERWTDPSSGFLCFLPSKYIPGTVESLAKGKCFSLKLAELNALYEVEKCVCRPCPVDMIKYTSDVCRSNV